MRIRALLASAAVGASMLTVGAIAPAANAAAPAQPVAVSATLSSYYTSAEAGDTITFHADVDPTTPDVYYIGAGSTQLQRRLPGSTAWQTIATDSDAFPSFGLVTVTSNADYRMYYTGGTYSHYPNDYAFAPAYSNIVHVSAYRKVDLKDTTTRASGARGLITVTPGFARHKLTVQVLKKGHWKKYKVAKTNAKGKVSVTFASSRKGIWYRLVAPADKNFVQTVSGKFKAYRY